MTQHPNLNSWDIEDDDVKNEDTLQFDSETGLYKQVVTTEKDGKIVKEIWEYKLVVNKVSQSVKRRSQLKKYGKAKDDPKGPNPAHTYFGEEVFMKFITDENVEQEEDKKNKDQTLKCRKCNGAHFTHKCPYKEEIDNIQEISAKLERMQNEPAGTIDEKPKIESMAKSQSSRYLPPHMKEDKKSRESDKTIRVTNLPEAARESDLEDLFRPFGSLSRTFLAKDKVSGISRGFAYITFNSRQDALKAIEGVNGFGYDHCILQVEWAKPQ